MHTSWVFFSLKLSHHFKNWLTSALKHRAIDFEALYHYLLSFIRFPVKRQGNPSSNFASPIQQLLRSHPDALGKYFSLKDEGVKWGTKNIELVRRNGWIILYFFLYSFMSIPFMIKTLEYRKIALIPLCPYKQTLQLSVTWESRI